MQSGREERMKRDRQNNDVRYRIEKEESEEI
jgi:hypothetical protein